MMNVSGTTQLLAVPVSSARTPKNQGQIQTPAPLADALVQSRNLWKKETVRSIKTAPLQILASSLEATVRLWMRRVASASLAPHSALGLRAGGTNARIIVALKYKKVGASTTKRAVEGATFARAAHSSPMRNALLMLGRNDFDTRQNWPDQMPMHLVSK